jgi:methionyl-tRNA synthetase
MTSSPNDPFYITTPIYYVNDVPHLGTAYCTIAADVLARYERLSGKMVNFLTGTDEHGEKVQEAAFKKNRSPQEFTDEVSAQFVNAWSKLNISNDDFIRTTEDRHKKTVAILVEKALESGAIYLGEYEGWYCVSDETFYTESQLVNHKCPTCGKDVKKIKEENYFFKLSHYVKVLKDHIEKNPDFRIS